MRRRQLQVTPAGLWFLVLTILLGVAALASGNNIIYLLESLLMGVLIVSGWSSDRALHVVRVEWELGQAQESAACSDYVRVRNLSRWAVDAIELGEWRGGVFCKLAYVPRLQGRSELCLRVERLYARRGRESWEARGVATSWPFGFARKLRSDVTLGERLVWPRGLLNNNNLFTESSSQAGTQWSESEVKVLGFDEDVRFVLWNRSAGHGEWIARSRVAEEPALQFRLSCKNSLENFEDQIHRIATQIYALRESPLSAETSLDVETASKIHRYRGRRAVLDALALIQRESLTDE